MEKQNQRQRILQLFSENQYLIPTDFIKAGIYRYSARIMELRLLGYEIVTKMRVVDKKKQFYYILESEEKII